ncbi:hypothetical protein OG874_43690 [Nocardia sp. NBC_00565]|uniref:hypothetical protein n=1 Tax=Nocardia sp. NBC_00565 TaxID=2975993 RepID=UPI002E810E85|nr:hypothetical protein [Nocardia sp. NBC_00565]WUC03477.1 hypothetical protein OG874_43690 [Nocardia sp. NBC_00565]
MTREALQQLPEEIADFIELRDGRPLWIADEIMARHGLMEHQTASRRLTSALETAGRRAMSNAGPISNCDPTTGPNSIGEH